ncbi:conserved hypothetical protein [uncultured Desulfobacterium sp.]|uniref:Asparagine synthetase domain-containing protein n=1 Tax=uncultured Desulfobacterium sp. TaxID=201089 RepID=A0A445N0Q7_9BACT|nr:conserved hypothetical protein [uncultured Desulfobacterium sp.]
MYQDSVRKKKESLISNLMGVHSLVVAFSGGVDSSFLLAIAQDILKERVIAATARSAIHSHSEIEYAIQFASQRRIRHIVFESGEMNNPEFLSNGPDRCYHCKRQLAETLFAIAEKEGLSHVAHGANVDDLSDYRPGLAAARETGIISPLTDSGLTKAEIRYLSKGMGLENWDMPAMACLATRIPYGSRVTEEKLQMADEAEGFLFELGFKQVRVRHHGTVARIEVGIDEFENLMEDHNRSAIVAKFRGIGFLHVATDLEGYISGKLNRDLEKQTAI